MDIRSLLDTLTQIEQPVEEAPRKKGQGRRERNYQQAQQQMANLEKAAQYTGNDSIVRQRMGLPPKLPSIDKWDGKMPEPTGEPDWLAKLGSGFKIDRDAQGNLSGATSNATTAQQQAMAQNKGIAGTAKFLDKTLPKIKAILNKVDGKGMGGKFRTVTAGLETDQLSIAESLVMEFGYDEFEMPIVEAELTPQEEKELADLMAQISDIDDPRVQRIQRRYQKYLKNIKGKAAATGIDKPADSEKPASANDGDAGDAEAKANQDRLEFSKDLDTIIQLLQKKSGGAAVTPVPNPQVSTKPLPPKS